MTRFPRRLLQSPEKEKLRLVTTGIAATIAFAATADEQAKLPAADGTFGDVPLQVTAAAVGDGDGGVAGLKIKLNPNFNKERIGGFSRDREAEPGERSLLVWDRTLSPQIDVEMGENGTFQKIIGKISGRYLFTNIGDVDADGDYQATGIRHSVPFGIGASTTRFGEHYAVLGEVGWVPWYPIKGFVPGGQRLILGYNPYFGLFVQGGYKFDGVAPTTIGGSVDQSSEPVNDYLLRLKADAKFSLNLPLLKITEEMETPQLITWATGWYDVAHDDFYHSVGAKLRFGIPGQDNKHLDFSIENGSGEPNFNQGTQFGAGLTVAF